jgi:hypothetical protein
MSLGHGPSIVRNGLVLCLDAANVKSYPGSGTTWNDVSGNNTNLTIYGGPAFNSAGYFTFSNNQTTQYIMNDNYSIPTDDISFSCWFRSNFAGASQTPFTYSVAGDNTYLLYTDSSTIIVPHDLGNRYQVTVPDMKDVWCNFTWVRTRTTGVSLYYMNGVYVGTQTINAGSGPTSGGYLIIGQEADAPGAGFDPAQNLDGDFAILSIYNRTLTAAEVSQNFNAVRGRFGI